jgi:two-component system, cell cycle response regulator
MDLEDALPQASPERPLGLVLFDLDGFKEYNDTFGHPAGDDLLVRLGERLADAVRGHGSPYRLGGDEFCVVVHPGAAGFDVLIEACVSALREHGEGFDVTTSYGAVQAPVEVGSATEALQVADRRMYSHKGDRRLSAGRQSRDVLLRSLSERQPDLHVHLRGTADLVVAVGRELGMDGEELDDVAQAAELHDVGKIAIPDDVLRKTTPLTDSERRLLQSHPLLGEQMVGGAALLRGPGVQVVRSHHERWDGSGYPDGLIGDEIPLPARIFSVADALDAITSDRPYSPARGWSWAVDEIRNEAERQFHPDVVDAFLDREEAMRRIYYEVSTN